MLLLLESTSIVCKLVIFNSSPDNEYHAYMLKFKPCFDT